MLARPMDVVILFLVLSDSDDAILDKDKLDNLQILLIVNPGIITEASACQTAASRKTSTDFWFLNFSFVLFSYNIKAK